MLVNLAHKVRLYPNNDQRTAFAKNAGCVRFVYNHFLALNKEYYAKTGKFMFFYEMCYMIPKLKKEYHFLSEANAQSLQVSLKNLDTALQNCFKHGKGFPVFKKKGDRDSFMVPQKFEIDHYLKQMRLSKIGWVKWRDNRSLWGAKSITVSQTCGNWYASVLVEREKLEPTKPVTPKVIGIDLGLKEFATLSNGEVIPNPKVYRKLESKLAKAQRKLSRKKVKSSNRKKQLRKVQRIHHRIANTRKDFLHKVSTSLVKNHDVIGIEDLNVKGMVKNRHLSKSTSDASWGMFNRMLEYKCLWRYKTLQKVGRFYPSSQLCSACGNRQKMPLNLRTFICVKCKTTIGRDHNAAKNIAAEACRLLEAA